jgi:hypothetical protein
LLIFFPWRKVSFSRSASVQTGVLRKCFLQKIPFSFFQKLNTSEYRIASQGSEVFRPPRWPEVHQKFTRILNLLKNLWNREQSRRKAIISLEHTKPNLDDQKRRTDVLWYLHRYCSILQLLIWNEIREASTVFFLHGKRTNNQNTLITSPYKR